MLFLLAAPEPEPAPEPTSAAVQVQAAVRNLPPTQRIIPHLVYDHDCSLHEIGRKQLAGLGWRRADETRAGGGEDSGLRYHQGLTALPEQALRQITTAAGHSFWYPAAHRRGNATIDEISQAAGGPMTDRLEFDTVCPNNHNQAVTFIKENSKKR